MSEKHISEQVAAMSRERKIISAGKGDVVRIAQAKSYMDLWETEDGGEMLDRMGLDLEQACQVVGEHVQVLSKADRDRIHAQMADLPKSHVWIKGACATAICLIALAEEAAEQTA